MYRGEKTSNYEYVRNSIRTENGNLIFITVDYQLLILSAYNTYFIHTVREIDWIRKLILKIVPNKLKFTNNEAKVSL